MPDVMALAKAELARLDKAKDTSLGLEWDNYVEGVRAALAWVAAGGAGQTPSAYIVTVLSDSMKALGG